MFEVFQLELDRWHALVNPLASDPLEVGAEQLSNVSDLALHHVQSVDAQTPSNYGDVDAHRDRDFGPEDAAAAELYPTEPFLVGLQFNARLGEREIVRLETDLLCSGDLFCESVQYAEEASKVQGLV